MNSNIEPLKINNCNNSNPLFIHLFKNIVEDSYCSDGINIFSDTFTLFNSLDNIFYLIYSNKNSSIILFDLINNQKINEIKNAHSNDITNFKYILDKNNKRDLFMSVCCKDNEIKLWDIKNLELLLNIKNVNSNGIIRSACFLNNNEQIYIITSNFNYNYSYNIEPIKVFDIKGNKIKEINHSKDITFFIDSYFDKKLNRNFILTGNSGNAKSYDFLENDIYYIYSDGEKEYRIFHNIIINDNEKIIKFIVIGNDANIRIFNFHTGEILKKIHIPNTDLMYYNMLYSICLWNNDYMFIGTSDRIIRLVEINNGKIVNNLFGHNSEILTIRKTFLHKYGECLISQANDQIKIWFSKYENNI